MTLSSTYDGAFLARIVININIKNIKHKYTTDHRWKIKSLVDLVFWIAERAAVEFNLSLKIS